MDLADTTFLVLALSWHAASTTNNLDTSTISIFSPSLVVGLRTEILAGLSRDQTFLEEQPPDRHPVARIAAQINAGERKKWRDSGQRHALPNVMFHEPRISKFEWSLGFPKTLEGVVECIGRALHVIPSSR